MFITLEGIEGSGKSTLTKTLQGFFKQNNQVVLATREPGGSLLGQRLRSIILNVDEKICPQAELFLFLADRAQHVKEVICPALARSEIVLCDRYIDSTIAYQGYGRGMDIDLLEMLNNTATDSLFPDVTFLLDLPPHIGLERARSRNHLENITQSEGRFEAEEISFHTRIRAGFLERAKKYPQRFIVLDATQSSHDLAKQVIDILKVKM